MGNKLKMMENLPKPSDEDIAISTKLCQKIQQIINDNNGFISFSEYMNHALYYPELGYYSGNKDKIGQAGDFTTAPQMTSLFGKTIANELTQILHQTNKNIYEFGAGTGKLAVDIIKNLADDVWDKYYIIELSADLKARQQAYFRQHIPHLQHKIEHLNRLPESFNGVIIGNEVLDAIPCEKVRWQQDGIYQVIVRNNQDGFEQDIIPATGLLKQLASQINPENLPYESEINLQQAAFIRTLSQRLTQGAMIWIDYGFDAKEYYHPQRNDGTLIGHYRHHTIIDPFFLTGLVDLTAHVDFSSVAQVATDCGLDFVGYTTQSHFLISAGILQNLEQIGDSTSHEYIKEVSACQKLLSPTEMGELFKVIAFSKNIDTDWVGFSGLDLSYKL